MIDRYEQDFNFLNTHKHTHTHTIFHIDPVRFEWKRGHGSSLGLLLADKVVTHF